ncbi:hypothetical protein PF005_g22126, partial [Phytophthora fragariae]
MSSMTMARPAQTKKTIVTRTTKAGKRTRRVVTITSTSTTGSTPTTATAVTKVATAIGAGKYKFIPEFGGQGTSYWTELQKLYAASKSSSTTRAFIDSVAQALLEESSTDAAKASVAFEAAIDVHSWLQSLEVGDAPADLALDCVYFSMPLLV